MSRLKRDEDDMKEKLENQSIQQQDVQRTANVRLTLKLRRFLMRVERAWLMDLSNWTKILVARAWLI